MAVHMVVGEAVGGQKEKSVIRIYPPLCAWHLCSWGVLHHLVDVYVLWGS